MSYEVGTYVPLEPDGRIARARQFQDALDSQTGQEIGTSYRFDKNLKPLRVIPVLAL